MAVDVYNLGKLDYAQFDRLWYNTTISSTGTYQLAHKVTDYNFLIVHYSYYNLAARQANTIIIGKSSSNVKTGTNAYCCIHGLQNVNAITYFHFSSSDYSKLVVDQVTKCYITSIIGVK